MEDVRRIYILLLHSNGLTIRDIAKELDLDKYYVADILFSTDNIPFWYQDNSLLWFAKEDAIEIEEPQETKDPLISSIEIPQKFNINRFLEEDISDSLRSYLYQISKYRTYSNDEMIELFKRYRNGDNNAFDLIIMSQQRLVANIALLYCRKGAPLEDIIQEGNVGLVKAVERFDYTQYLSLSNYAKSWILQSISLAMYSMPYMIRLPQNLLSLYRKVQNFKEHYEQENGYSPSINDIDINESIDLEQINYLDGLPHDLKSLVHLSDNMDAFESSTSEIEDFINKNEVQITVKQLLSCLRKRERQIIEMFYGIKRNEESLEFIGDYFGLTRERARQIKEATVRHLRNIYHNRIENVVLYNKSIYWKEAQSPKTNREYVHTKKERQQFHLSTPLSELVVLNIITEKQLRQCRKKGLRFIGDVKHIIEKYGLTTDSTRFTKYTLDMWFNIINLIKE